MKTKLIGIVLLLSIVLGACMNADAPIEDALAAGSESDKLAQPEEEPPVNSAGFANTLWLLEELNGVEAVAADTGGTQAFLQYDPETGKLNGSTGCNQYFADVQVDLEARTITVGALGMTRMACRGGAADQEFAFTALLQKAARYEVDGSRLTLLAEDGAILVFAASGE